MKTVSLSGSKRSNVGKKDAKSARVSGQVPCVVYGGKEQMFFNVPILAFEKSINSPDVYCYNLNIDGVEKKAILQDTQFHPINDSVMHADFLEIIEGKELIISIPSKLNGNSEGVKAGGKLVKGVRKLKISAKLQHVPDYIEVDVTKLNIGDTIKVKELKMDNVKFLDAQNVVVVAVRTTRAAQQAEAAAAAPAAAKKAAPAKK